MADTFAGYELAPHEGESGFGTRQDLLDPRDGTAFAVLVRWEEKYKSDEPFWTVVDTDANAVMHLTGTTDLADVEALVREAAARRGC